MPNVSTMHNVMQSGHQYGDFGAYRGLDFPCPLGQGTL